MGKVLIVDDSRIIRRQLARMMDTMQLQTCEAPDGQEGLQAIEQERPDCILLDILMPKMDGIQFLTAAKSKGVTIPIIVMSADAQTPDRAQHLITLGAFAVVDKPPQGEAPLLDAVKRVFTPRAG